MSLLNDYSYADLTSFGGPNLLSDPTLVGRGNALLAKNVEYSAGSVGTRHGYGTTGLPTSVFEMYEWIAPFSEIDASYSDNALALMRQGSSTDTALVIVLLSGTQILGASSGAGVSADGSTMIGVGLRLYMALFTSKQAGLTVGGVVAIYNNAGTAGGSPAGTQFRNLFNGTSDYAPTTSEPAAGLVTAGVHRLGYLIEYAGGFTTRVSPDPSLVFGTPAFAPISVTASGSKNLRLAFGLGWNASHAAFAEMVAVSIVMTTTTNLNQYYIVPGSRTPLSAIGSVLAFDVDLSISDADLSSQGIDATPYLYWLCQGSNNDPATTGTFKVRHICLFGDRMAYLATQTDNMANTIDTIYISERSSYQSITLDQHGLQLPGQRPVVTMFRMGAANYIVGPHEIWASTDNNDVPVSWAAPQLTDGRHGTLAIHGVEVSPSGNYAWVADQAGLYLFIGGPITALPVSYYQTPDWNRINWNSAYCVRIKDDAGNKRVHVMVPLDGATTPSHIMTWDYTNGITPEAVMYSLDNISGFNLGGMELMRNDLPGQAAGNNGKIELWVGPSDSSTIQRKMTDLDTHPYRDLSTSIASTYRTCPLPGRGVSQGQILMHHGFGARVTGSGNLTPTVHDIDGLNSFTGRTITLSATPDRDELVLARMRNELAYVEFATDEVDTHFKISYLRWYYSQYLSQR